jgi:Flp pilus assembly pilin Flp
MLACLAYGLLAGSVALALSATFVTIVASSFVVWDLDFTSSIRLG